MSSKLFVDSISYDQENYDKLKSSKGNSNLKSSYRKTTSALVRNADALFDITNSPPQQSSNKHSHPLTPNNKSIKTSSTSTPSKPVTTVTSNNNTSSTPFPNILENTSLSPKSSRYTIAATPTKLNSSSTSTPTSANMMTLTQNQPSPSPMVSVAKSLFTPIKSEKKLKKKQLEKEYQLLQDKVKIMEKIRNDNDSDIERMKISLIDTLTENDRLQKRVSELEQSLDELKKELDKGSYESWKGYCSLQDSPPGVSTRYSKKRALNSNLNNNNL